MRLLTAIGLPVLVLAMAILVSIFFKWMLTFFVGRLFMIAFCGVALSWLAWIGWHYKDDA